MCTSSIDFHICKSSLLLKNYPEPERTCLWKSTAKRNKIFISKKSQSPIQDVWGINPPENYLASRSSELLNISGGYPGVLHKLTHEVPGRIQKSTILHYTSWLVTSTSMKNSP